MMSSGLDMKSQPSPGGEGPEKKISGSGRQPALEPGVDLAVPEQRVARLEHPVVLVGEVHETRGHPFGLEHAVALEPLGDRHAEVALAMDHEHRRVESLGEARRTPALDRLETIPWLATHGLSPSLGDVAGVLREQIV